MTFHELEDLEKQDKLKEGFFKTKKGKYLKFENCFEYSSIHAYRISPIKLQDKLNEGLIRVKRGNYFPLKDIKKVFEKDCFIATTIYGSPSAPQVQRLQEFRDNVLTQHSLGRAIISFYYNGAGEKTANLIKKHLSFAIPTIRKGLDTLVKTYSKRK